ncbi:hypothetical protein B0H17DRAFT_1135506 [Mycena rosella]|uniref:Uncharacterized protein n=1 Tax=Mycena rosella TaxID=1033263 RepID=A0AAD7DD07_MYCRO|nr:hypothetical protein B0H17DRAFT_1135506 [Mycena rosella]
MGLKGSPSMLPLILVLASQHQSVLTAFVALYTLAAWVAYLAMWYSGFVVQLYPRQYLRDRHLFLAGIPCPNLRARISSWHNENSARSVPVMQSREVSAVSHSASVPSSPSRSLPSAPAPAPAPMHVAASTLPPYMPPFSAQSRITALEMQIAALRSRVPRRSAAASSQIHAQFIAEQVRSPAPPSSIPRATPPPSPRFTAPSRVRTSHFEVSPSCTSDTVAEPPQDMFTNEVQPQRRPESYQFMSQPSQSPAHRLAAPAPAFTSSIEPSPPYPVRFEAVQPQRRSVQSQLAYQPYCSLPRSSTPPESPQKQQQRSVTNSSIALTPPFRAVPF